MAATPSPSATSASPSPTPSPVLRSPLTGMPVDALRPVLAVKIDNVAPARPQAGVQYADVVYEELVEGGQTRLMAIFSSRAAPQLGPVRSVRESDLDILAAYGKVLFAFSGGNDGVKHTVGKADVINGSWDAVPSAYRKQAGRKAPYHLFASTDALHAAKPGAAVARDIGLRFGPAAAGTPVTSFSLTWSVRARTGFEWDAATSRWLRFQDGSASTLLGGARMTPQNVLVQYVPIKASKYVDVNGERTPYTVTVGSGPVELYRDGKRIAGKWSRASKTAPTVYTDAAGRPLLLAPGQTFVLLAPNNLRTVAK